MGGLRKPEDGGGERGAQTSEPGHQATSGCESVLWHRQGRSLRGRGQRLQDPGIQSRCAGGLQRVPSLSSLCYNQQPGAQGSEGVVFVRVSQRDAGDRHGACVNRDSF